MLEDSFLRGAAENVRAYLRDKCNLLSVVKPGAGINEITQPMNNEISTLTSLDILILGGGSNGLDKCKAKTAFKSIINFVTSNNHTNIILLSILQHHDLQNYSHINNEINYNSKLYKITQAFNHAKFIEFDSNKIHFTKHGLHFSKLRTAHLAKQIASIAQLVLEKIYALLLYWIGHLIHQSIMIF
jgi:hypothetical protein